MTLESFFTVQNNLPPQQKQPKAAPPIVSENNAGDKPIKGKHFLEFILTQVEDSTGSNLGEQKAEIEIELFTPDTTTSIIPDELPETLDGENLTLLSELNDLEGLQEILPEITQLDGDLSLENTLSLNEAALSELQKFASLDQDGLIVEGDEIPQELSNLLNLNLTPSQLSALQDLSENEELPSDIFSAIVALVAPQQQIETLDNGALSASQEMAARLNALSSANEGSSDQMARLIKYLENFKASGNEGRDGPAAPDKSNALNALSKTPAFETVMANHEKFESALKGWPFSMDGSLLASLDGGLTDALAPQYGATTSANATQMGTLTSLIGQSQGAGHMHPATQMVAVNIQKAAGKGESTNLTLQLDPPELGRIEVQLNFTKEKTLKATITAEKPETHLMLQRDAQALERAIQDIGLDSDGGIAFELAEQGFDFDQNNQRGGGHDDGGTGAGDTNNDEFIETTMTWHVDPESGHMRYDILV